MSTMQELNEFAEAMRHVPQIIDRAADEVGSYLVETLRNRVRLGFGVARDGDKKQKFKPLAPSTIKHREWLSLAGKLFQNSRPNRSHLTATGQMMDSLTYAKKPGRVVLFFNNQEAENKAFYNNEGGRVPRPFFYLTDLEIKATERTLQKALDEYIEGIAQTL